MSTAPPAIIFVLGPSGAGKSFIAQHLQSAHCYLHLEIDKFPLDGIDSENIRAEWDDFYGNGNATDLVATLRARAAGSRRDGIALSFPSGVVLSPMHIRNASTLGVIIAILYGPTSHCMNSFLEREKHSGRNLTAEHWIANNASSHQSFSDPAYAQHRVAVFELNGRRRTPSEIVREILSLAPGL